MARLLVVDDEPDMCDLLTRRLVREGHEILAADGAVTAWELVERHGMPDAVILDVDMPGTDGFALLEQLRGRDCALPALFITVLWHGDVHSRIQQLGAVFVAKPFTAAQLHTGVRRLLSPGPAGGAAPGRPS